MIHIIKGSKKFLALFVALTLIMPAATPVLAWCGPRRHYYYSHCYYYPRPYYYRRYCDNSAVTATIGLTTGLVIGTAITANRQSCNCNCTTTGTVTQSRPLIMHRFH